MSRVAAPEAPNGDERTAGFRRPLTIVTIATLVLLPIIALVRGQDANWDQFNYHFYVADAALRGTFAYNVAPAQMQSWLNPTAYIPIYWLAGWLSPFGVKLALALLQSLNAPLLFLIAVEVQPRDRDAPRFAALATLIGMTTATFLGEAGTTFFDINATLLTSGALLLCLRADASDTAWHQARLLVMAGALMGVAAGLKLTNAAFALALGVAVLAAAPRSFIPRGSAYALGALAGFIAAAGWWMALLWDHYGNPFFPYFNAVFHSPWLDGVPPAIASGSGADMRFLPATILRALQLPIDWAAGSTVTSEYWYRDPRVLLAILLLIAAGVIRRRQSSQPSLDELTPRIRTVLIFAAISLALWMRVFAIQRYLIPIEVLAGIAMMIAIRGLIAQPRQALLLFGALTAATIGLTRAPAYGDIRFHDRMIASRDLRPLYRSGALYVMTGNAALGFIVPALPHDARFVRIDGNMPLDPDTGLGRLVTDIIAGHRGPLYSLETPEELAASANPLARFGLRASTPCLSAKALNQDIIACPLTKVGRRHNPGEVDRR